MGTKSPGKDPAGQPQQRLGGGGLNTRVGGGGGAGGFNWTKQSLKGGFFRREKTQ